MYWDDFSYVTNYFIHIIKYLITNIWLQ